MQHATPELLGRRVDELDLVGSAHDPVGDSFADLGFGDRFHGISDRFEVLDVERAGVHDGDARVEQLKTSCHRSLRPDPGTFVWAISSTRATSGWRASTASTSISSKVEPRYSTFFAGTTSRSWIASIV